ncbi:MULTISPECIES: condensation domain-containing protein [unclassified Pseudomonas]|uniref:condensation domain-containing protein n=1 Tax=unclassified Pseudomonas TaxID=196821 RepID=UPI00215FA9B8|nr:MULTISPECIES: condensation domain-containing protein [unclassified Pseudomonas]UVM52700.1 condensation domain-containing protein [Pseudomonas sp. B21-015]WPN60170.1 condensation domain-containing protein [Pseudomonas sp. P9_31]
MSERLKAQRVKIARRERSDRFSLSFSQRRLWYIYQLNPASTMYNMPECVRLRGPLDLEVFQGAFEDVITRHESLRVTFLNTLEGPVQIVNEQTDCAIEVVDLSSVSDEQMEARARELLFEISDRPFDLGRGPVVRLSLVRMAHDHHFLLINMHHIVSDGWSMGVFARDFSAFVAARVLGMKPDLPPLEVGFGDFVEWQIGRLNGPAMDKQMAYWRPRLKQVEDLVLPFDRLPTASTTERGGFEYILFDRVLADGINACARECGVTLYMMLLAAFCVALHRQSLQSSITVGSPTASRVRAETENLIGFFANTLLITSAVWPDMSFREVAQGVRESALGAFNHDEMPFEKLVETLHPDRDSSRSPLFQVMFILQNTQKPSLNLPGLLIEPFAAGSLSVKFDMLIEFYESPEGITGWLGYRRDLFDERTCKRFADNYHRLLTSIITDPDQLVSELSMEVEPIVTTFNDDLDAEF